MKEDELCNPKTRNFCAHLRRVHEQSLRERGQTITEMLSPDTIENKFNVLFDWSKRISEAATMVLNRGEPEDKIRLRQCVDEWIENFN